MEGEINSEQEVADSFNQFFIDKIKHLKGNIDPNQGKDPLDKLETKLKNKPYYRATNITLVFHHSLTHHVYVDKLFSLQK